MKKMSAAVLAAILLLSLCACSGKENTAQDKTDGDSLIAYEDDSGVITYTFGDPDDKKEEKPGELIDREYYSSEAEPAPEGSISVEEAAALLDGCSAEDMYLPCPVSELQKQQEGTRTLGSKLYYRFSFYTEKSSVRMYLGTYAYVAVDGSQIRHQDWAGTTAEADPKGAEKDKPQNELFSGAKISPTDALFVLYNGSRKKMGLDENISSYTFEIDNKLSEIKSVPCYKIMPKLNYTNMMKMGKPIYVSADGKDFIIMKSEETNKYEEIK